MCVADVKYASVIGAAEFRGFEIVGNWSYEDRFRRALDKEEQGGPT